MPSVVVDQVALARLVAAHRYWKLSTDAPAGLASQDSVSEVAPRVMLYPVGRHGPLVVWVTATVPVGVKPVFSPRSHTV